MFSSSELRDIMMGERKTYSGQCHCGAVKFDVTTDLGSLGVCNCSMCSRLGWVMQTVPEADFHLREGADQLGTYRFNTRLYAHQFCKVCGIESFARGEDGQGNFVYTVNTACLADLPEIDRAAVKHWDGRNMW
jgi:hypothetical protein